MVGGTVDPTFPVYHELAPDIYYNMCCMWSGSWPFDSRVVVCYSASVGTRDPLCSWQKLEPKSSNNRSAHRLCCVFGWQPCYCIVRLTNVKEDYSTRQRLSNWELGNVTTSDRYTLPTSWSRYCSEYIFLSCMIWIVWMICMIILLTCMICMIRMTCMT